MDGVGSREEEEDKGELLWEEWFWFRSEDAAPAGLLRRKCTGAFQNLNLEV